MRPQFTIEALKTRELSEVWTIVRSSGSYANEDWWVAEATELIENGGGVLVARAPDGGRHGLATFEGQKVPSERTLVIRTLITFELSSTAPAKSALLRALSRIATKLDCTHVVLPLSGKPAIWLSSMCSKDSPGNELSVNPGSRH